MHIDGSHSDRSYRAGFHHHHHGRGHRAARAELAASKGREFQALQAAPSGEAARPQFRGARVEPIVDAIVSALRNLNFGGAPPSAVNPAASKSETSQGAPDPRTAPVVDAIIDALRNFSSANLRPSTQAAPAATSVPSPNVPVASEASTTSTEPVAVSSEVLNSVADAVRQIGLNFRPGTEEVTIVAGGGSDSGTKPILDAIAGAITGLQLSSGNGQSAVDQIASAVEALQLDDFQEDLDAIIVLGGNTSSEGGAASGGFLAAIANVIRGLQVSDPNAQSQAVSAAKPQPTTTATSAAVPQQAEVIASASTQAVVAPEAQTTAEVAELSDITIPGASLNQFASVQEALDLRSALVEALLGEGSSFLESLSGRSFDFSVEISARYQSDTEEFEIGERFELKA